MSVTDPWRKYFYEYCSKHFMFAVRYLAKRKTRATEKYFWIIWLCASLGACLFSMVQMYHKWDANPVTIVYGAELEPVSAIPFPAITICPLLKSRVEVFNLSQAINKLEQNISIGGQNESKLETLAHVCPFRESWKQLNSSREENIVPHLKMMTNSLENVMVHCWWRSSIVPCQSIMAERLVDDGICYTFNSLALDEIYNTDHISPDFLNFSNEVPSSDWTREHGYASGAGVNAYPNRPLTNGIISGAVLTAASRRIDHEPFCTGAHTGFKFSVHPPDEVALTDDRFYRLDTLSALMLDLTPKVIQATESLRNLSPFKRNCYFSDERFLRFFKRYNQINCVVECVSNYTLAKCGCVKFSMPRSVSTKICDVSKIECYRGAFGAMYDSLVNASLAKRQFPTCNCLPSCTSIDYGVGISQDAFNFHNFPMELDFVEDEVDPSLLFVSFKDRHYTFMVRRELMGINKAIAELGGLLALLMGSSVLSLAEIVYYCCIRRLRSETSNQKGKFRETYPQSQGHRVRRRVDPWAKHQWTVMKL